MVKQIITLIVLSVLVVVGSKYMQPGLESLMNFYQWLVYLLKELFKHSLLGDVLIRMLPLFIIPLLVAGIIALGYWIMKRGKLSWVSSVMWVIWIVMATLIVFHFH